MKIEVTKWLVENGVGQPFEAMLVGLVFGLIVGYILAK